MARRIWILIGTVLVWVLFMGWVLRLRLVFVEEHQQARARIDEEREVLRRHVKARLSVRLSEAARAARPKAERALIDPLAPAEGIVLFDGEEQRLPRAPAPIAESAARDIFEALPSLPDGASPWVERVRLAGRVEAALRQDDEEAVEAAVLAFFRHRDRFVLEVDRDLASAVWVLERLVEHSRPSPAFLADVLRDGVLRQAGLQRALVHEQGRLSDQDRRFLAERVVRLSKRSEVRVDDFLRRLAERGAWIERPDVVGPALVEHRYFEPEGDRLLGVRVDRRALVAHTRADLVALGVLEPVDRIELADRAVQPLSDLSFAVDSSRIESAQRRADARLREKSMLLFVAVLLAHAFGAAGALLLLRHRRTLAQRSEFVASVSHELRTPVASIRLLAETLERWAERAPSKAAEYRARLIRETDRLSFLVENILSYNRLSRGRLSVRPSSVSLGELVLRMEEALSIVAEKPFEVTLEEDAVLFVDPDLFGLVLLNLGRNAIDYGDRSPVRLRVRCTPQGGVEFADNGPGIDPKEQPRIFSAFQRGAAGRARRSGGSGLGLAICRRVMEAHGGTIRVGASGLHGTTFEMRFEQ